MQALRAAVCWGSGMAYLTLEPGTLAAGVAAACRYAGTEFLRGVRAGWDARDLAAWLTGPYADATRHAPRGEHAARTDAAEPETARLRDVLGHARSSALAALEEACSSAGGLTFVREAIRAGAVVPARVEGGSCWIPVDLRGMHLAERVLSLFAVDLLLYPEDYSGALVICPLCEAVVYDPEARALGQCGAHRPSGLVHRIDQVLIELPHAPTMDAFFDDYESDSAIPLTRVR
jgi:hypothetical protein